MEEEATKEEEEIQGEKVKEGKAIEKWEVKGEFAKTGEETTDKLQKEDQEEKETRVEEKKKETSPEEKEEETTAAKVEQDINQSKDNKATLKEGNSPDTSLKIGKKTLTEEGPTWEEVL